MSAEPVQARWLSFLDKIDERLRDLLDRSAAALPQLVDLKAFDVVPFLNASMGVHSQSIELIAKIEVTWRGQVEAAFEEADASLIAGERQRGTERCWALEEKLRRTEIEMAADAARRLMGEAQRVLGQTFSCSQCRAPLPVRMQFFRSYYLPCEYCQKVNTFEPGMSARMVEAFAVHALAEYAALEPYLKHFVAEQRGAMKVERVALYEIYVQSYLRARIQIIPEYEKEYEKDLKAKLDSFVSVVA